jgi:hypothetical protein
VDVEGMERRRGKGIKEWWDREIEGGGVKG